VTAGRHASLAAAGSLISTATVATIGDLAAQIRKGVLIISGAGAGWHDAITPKALLGIFESTHALHIEDRNQNRCRYF
jgi:hypothetical protein